MLMKAIVLVVGVAASSARVVQGQTTDPCSDFNNKKCGKKDECTWNSEYEFCLLTAGTGSVVRDGSENAAPGKYSAIGGGQRNDAGYAYDAYNIIGGGSTNACYGGSKNTISGGNFNKVSNDPESVEEFSTISGGRYNAITDSSYSVITGGGAEQTATGELGRQNIIYGCDRSTISGGKRNHIFESESSGNTGNTMTGGFFHTIRDSEKHSAITGGRANTINANGGRSVVAGGEFNRAFGTNSLAFGQNSVTTFDHSMVVNLIGGLDEGDVLTGTEDGEFLVTAESFLFQIGNGNDGIDSTELTKTNIQNLRTALEEEE